MERPSKIYSVQISFTKNINKIIAQLHLDNSSAKDLQ